MLIQSLIETEEEVDRADPPSGGAREDRAAGGRHRRPGYAGWGPGKLGGPGGRSHRMSSSMTTGIRGNAQ